LGKQPPLVEVDSLVVSFQVNARNWGWRSSVLRAVDNVSLQIERGESLAVVGESGSGKSTLGRSLLGLYRPVSGHVYFEGLEVNNLRGAALKRFQSRTQMIFQDPYASLNARMKVGSIIAEPLRAHRFGTRKQRSERVAELLTLVGLPRDSSDRFPYAFSGGQRQRIGIARALALSPEFVVADEPVSALDVSVQAQIVNLLTDLRDELSLTMIFIAHNLAVVRHVASRVAVMYLGSVVESGRRDEVFNDPLHPYTRALLRSIPPPDPAARWTGEDVALRGEIPSPINLPSGCRFHTRCPEAIDICKSVAPELQVSHTGHTVACHLVHLRPAAGRDGVTARDKLAPVSLQRPPGPVDAAKEGSSKPNQQ
jgi:oligopeptide transport system ATP-binding protein